MYIPEDDLKSEMIRVLFVACGVRSIEHLQSKVEWFYMRSTTETRPTKIILPKIEGTKIFGLEIEFGDVKELTIK